MPPAVLQSRLAFLLAAILALSTVTDRASAAGISVAPNRIVLEGRTFAATVYLTNRSNQTNTYRIGFTQLRMLESGAIVPADPDDDTGELYADELIRYSPRRTVIPAGGSQTVRLLVRRPRGNMPQSAEYRTHLSIRSVPDVPRLDELENEPAPEIGDNELSVRAVASVETLVPVIVRFGRLDAEAAISDLQLEWDEEPTIRLDLEREGTRSLYGEIRFTHVAPDGRTSPLGFMKGIAVYTPLARRHLDYRFPVPAGVDLTQGTLRVEFEETPDGGGDQTADAEIRLEGLRSR